MKNLRTLTLCCLTFILTTINLPAQTDLRTNVTAEWLAAQGLSGHPQRHRVVTHTNTTVHAHPLPGGGTTNIVLESTTQEVVTENEPCVVYHYYGLLHTGGIREMCNVPDHDPILNTWENSIQSGEFDVSFYCVLRAEMPASKLVIIRHHAEAPKPVFTPGFYPNVSPANPPMPDRTVWQTNGMVMFNGTNAYVTKGKVGL